MADCIVSQITQNLKDRLESLSTYGGTPTVELSRLFLNINDRYPYIEIIGPAVEVETQTHQVTDSKLEYMIKYYINVNDENETENGEITYLTRNVAADIIKHIMNDVSRGNLAQNTKATEYGCDFEIVGEDVEFFVYVVIEIQALIEATDPYLIG
uniref:Tail protein n=1 Tax=viral metagenome TaxID=1070528 RepID=A0A6M3M6E0_9ZZZZ